MWFLLSQLALAQEPVTLTPELGAQLQAEVDAVDGRSALSVRRLRAGALLDAPTDGLSARVNLDLSPRSLELIDLWAQVERGATTLRVGVVKLPFSVYRDTSFADLGLVDWSPVTRTFGSERQLGLQLWTGTDALHVSASLTQGQGTRTSHAMGLSDLTNTTVCGFASLTGPACPLALDAPELALRLGWTTADDDGPQAGVFASATVDASPELGVDLASRLALETQLSAARLRGELGGYLAWAPTPTEGWVPGFAGLRGELGWQAHAHFEPTLRVSYVDVLPGAAALAADPARAEDVLELAGGARVPIASGFVALGDVAVRPTGTTPSTLLRLLVQVTY